MPNPTSRQYTRGLPSLAIAPLAALIAVACSREPAPKTQAPAKPAATASAPVAAPQAVVTDVNRMDCMGADGIRFALDFDAGKPHAFEYASSNPADRSIICRYVASEGDATSTWQREADGRLTVELKQGANSGPAKFILAPNDKGWRVQIVAESTTGGCASAAPPNLMELTGRPGQECSLTAQGGVAASANVAVERQKALCESARFDVVGAPPKTRDPAQLFRELPEGIVGMSRAQREAVLATGSERLEHLDPDAGFLSVKRELKSFDHREDAEGYTLSTFVDGSGRTVVALVTMGLTGVKQGIWRTDAKGWERVGCELIDDYRVDYQYFPVAAGKALDVFDPNGQPAGHLTWNGERFTAAR